MKKFFFLIVLMVTTTNLFGQSEEYPRYYIQGEDTIGVIYTIDQVQKIYNHEVLLSLFKDVRLGCDTLLQRYLVVVNKYEQKQLVDKLLIEQHEKSLIDKDNEIKTHLAKTTNLENDIKKCDEQRKLQDGQIQNFEKVIDQLNKERKWLLGGSMGFAALSLFLLGTLVGN